MEINPVDASYLQSVQQEQNAEALYAVKLFKMAQASEAVAGSLLEDTAEFSKEAMDKFLSERAKG